MTPRTTLLHFWIVAIADPWFLPSVVSQAPLTGDADCPCLPAHDDDHTALVDLEAILGPTIPIETYGTHCSAHDESSRACSDASACASILPLPPECDRSYCQRAWCYVDPENCERRHSPSAYFEGRHYSYAACGEVDRFAPTERIQSLQGRTFRVGYTSNTGGWKGSYNPEGSFASNDLWRGPIVEFFHTAALEGGFRINTTAPPEWLVPMSRDFFGSESRFDLCVYAVSLGYLDFCVGSFTINPQRSAITTLYETTADPVYLITFDDREESQTSWESFSKALRLVFQPFTTSAWVLILVFTLPILGLLMFYHEYDKPGSSYPRNEPVLVERIDGLGHRSTEVVFREIPKYKHIFNSLYMAILSLFHGSYDHSVVTIGGKLNLLGMASFVMFIISVYTANLASILTQRDSKPSVDSVQMAIRQGMNICAERKKANIVIESLGIDPRHFVPDPVDLGGDGKPGFNCNQCNSRTRVFESMRKTHSDGSKHCNVAVASLEDLETMHRYGNHCDKVKVGDAIAYPSAGIPINDGNAEALVSLFHKLKSEGAMTRALSAEAPQSQCPETGGEGSSLDVQQLTGVWVITFLFALLSLVARFVSRPIARPVRRKSIASGIPRNEQMLRRCNQWSDGPPIDVVVNGYRYYARGNTLQQLGAGAETDPLCGVESSYERTEPISLLESRHYEQQPLPDSSDQEIERNSSDSSSEQD